VAWHELGRGIAVALYTMEAARRSPLDSHIGMMLFKNGIPVGYGGGWPFGGTCRIGVNMFAPYRGGESAYLCGQALHVYGHRFRVDRFIAEPSQFGGTNKEGLASGAFWFYYRLGFRPIDARAARLASDEFVRMQADAGYRTPIPVLRRFTQGDIELRVRETTLACDPIWLSQAVSEWIADRFHGDRTAAERAATSTLVRNLGASGHERWPTNEQHAFRVLALLFAQIPGIARWPVGDRKALVRLMRAKGNDELRFQDLVARHRRLRAALVALAATRSA
jgi:hypothetical protein